MTLNLPKALISVYHMSKFQRIYTSFAASRPKERIDYVLEPMQAMIQLACLSVCPTGTKVSISNNILCIQHPSWNQGLWRTYNQDNKDDLFHLFNVIGRYRSFYGGLRRGELGRRLFELLREMAVVGLGKLLETYCDTDKPSLLQMLNMYKVMLESATVLQETGDGGDMVAPHMDLGDLDGSLEVPRGRRSDSLDTASQTSEGARSLTETELPEDRKELDNIFGRIVHIYTDNELEVIYHTMQLMQRNQANYYTYIDGLSRILDPTNKRIRKWIADNIVF